jgi:hypothetical protein
MQCRRGEKKKSEKGNGALNAKECKKNRNKGVYWKALTSKFEDNRRLMRL